VVFDAYVYRGLLSQYDTGIMTNNATILCVMRSISAWRKSVLEYSGEQVRKKKMMSPSVDHMWLSKNT